MLIQIAIKTQLEMHTKQSNALLSNDKLPWQKKNNKKNLTLKKHNVIIRDLYFSLKLELYHKQLNINEPHQNVFIE